MIKIKKDNIEKEVTKGAYENLYKAMGFEIVGDKKPVEVKEAKIVEEVKEVAEPTPAPKKEISKNDIEDFLFEELKENKKKGSK